MATKTIGISGTGILGRGIAERLRERGFDVAVYDPIPEATEGLASLGIRVCRSNRELGGATDRLCVLVRDDAQCEQALRGDDGALNAMPRRGAVAIHSTVHPETVQRLALAASERGIDLLDAPVAGQGVHSLARGDFWLLGGGDEEVLERFRDVAEAFCERILHCGPLGSGSTLKLAHNVATYVSYLAIAEACDLADAAGVKPGMVEAVTESSGTLSGSMKTVLAARAAASAPGMADRMGGFATLLEKDLRVANELARKHGLELQGAGAAARMSRMIYGLEPLRPRSED